MTLVSRLRLGVIVPTAVLPLLFCEPATNSTPSQSAQTRDGMIRSTAEAGVTKGSQCWGARCRPVEPALALTKEGTVGRAKEDAAHRRQPHMSDRGRVAGSRFLGSTHECAEWKPPRGHHDLCVPSIGTPAGPSVDSKTRTNGCRLRRHPVGDRPCPVQQIQRGGDITTGALPFAEYAGKDRQTKVPWRLVVVPRPALDPLSEALGKLVMAESREAIGKRAEGGERMFRGRSPACRPRLGAIPPAVSSQHLRFLAP